MMNPFEKWKRDGSAKAAIALLDSWLAEDPQYDKEVWPKLKEAMERGHVKPIHGSCCTCQRCGRHYDECRCMLDDVADELEEEKKNCVSLERRLKIANEMRNKHHEMHRAVTEQKNHVADELEAMTVARNHWLKQAKHWGKESVEAKRVLRAIESMVESARSNGKATATLLIFDWDRILAGDFGDTGDFDGLSE